MGLILTIAGAPDEMRCEGGPCPGCHYAATDAQRWACTMAVDADPLAGVVNGVQIAEGVFYDSVAVEEAGDVGGKLIELARAHRKAVIVGV
jgi:hypothetical protein